MVDFKTLLEQQKQKQAMTTAPTNLKEQIALAKTQSKTGLFLAKKSVDTSLAKPMPKNVQGTVGTTGEPKSAASGSPAPTVSPAIQPKKEEENLEKKFGQHALQPEKMPDDVEKQFRESMTLVVDSFENKEILGQAVQHTMQFLQQHPALCEILAPEDIQLLVRGLRETYGVKVLEKTEKREKKVKKSAELEELYNELQDILR